jgi:hypothetical protein
MSMLEEIASFLVDAADSVVVRSKTGRKTEREPGNARGRPEIKLPSR